MLLTSATFRYARCLALQANGDRPGTLREQAAFENFRARVAPDALWGKNKAVPVLAVASEVLEARVATSAAEALPHWERAVALQDALVYEEPPAWYYPVRESWGAALLGAGKAAEAEAVFREGLKRSPRNGRILFGLMESLRAEGKTEAAEMVRKEFEANWAKADVKVRIDEM
jgi:hypothetical protein